MGEEKWGIGEVAKRKGKESGGEGRGDESGGDYKFHFAGLAIREKWVTAGPNLTVN